MVKVELGYGRGRMCLDIEAKNYLDTLLPRKEVEKKEAAEMIAAALDEPIATKPLRELVKPGQKVVIAISDVTRPCPSHILLPPVIQRLNEAGIADEDITIVSALGSHRNQSKEEQEKLVGSEIYRRIKVEDSTAGEFIKIGQSSRGTPFELAVAIVKADVRIGLGNIDYHYFAGYSGGVKAIVPGACTRRTIEANHKMMLEAKAKVGNLEENPVRDDLEEVLDILSLDFILNVVLNEKKEVIGAVAGDAIKAHRRGCAILDEIYKQEICQLADIVIASPGGLPKDLNVYQTQKALDNAQWAVKENGTIILVGECREGYGEGVFEQWLKEANSPADLLSRIQREFRLGGHKAAAIAAVTQKAKVFLVSSLSEEMVKKLYMTPFQDLKAAFAAALETEGPEAKAYVMPVAGTTLPVWRGQQDG